MNYQTNFEAERERMVKEQIEARGIHDQRVLEAMRKVPRHRFVPPEHQRLAYSDGPLPIGSGQTISQPYIVALMTQLLLINDEDKVLEIGTGSGYQAAVLGHLAGEVHSVEIHADLAGKAEDILSKLRLDNVHVHVGDGSLGWPKHAPYDAIIMTAAAPEVDQTLLDQLGDGGRLVLPVGGRGGQYLERWTRLGSDDFKQERLVPVAFVPLRGKSGWENGSWSF
jgi:protein-L-isoaspartate(D-aspartate) O-methyltransferase